MFKSFLIALFIGCSNLLYAQDVNADKLVMKAAEGQLEAFVGKIQPGFAKDYGFKEGDDLENCTVTKPYRVLAFNNEFYKDSLTENTNYIDIQNEWLVPVTVKGEHRVLLTVNGQSGNYKIASMGYPEMAKELEIKSAAYSENDVYYVLQVPSLNAYFFVSEKENSFADAEFIPLDAAKSALPVLRTISKSTISLDEIQSMIKKAVIEKAVQKEPAPKKATRKKTGKK